MKLTSRKCKPSPKKESPPAFIPVSDTLQCRFFDNAWHLVTLKAMPTLPSARERCSAVDILLKRRVAGITPEEARKQYGHEVYAVARRRLARRELSQVPIPSRWWGVA